MTHTTPPARMAASRIFLVPPWAEGLEVAPDATARHSESSDSNQCVVS